MAVLIDTSILVAVGSQREVNHARARKALREISEVRIVPAPMLPEMFYMLATRANYATALKMFHTLRTGAFRIEPLTDDDMTRMRAIMTDYEDSEFDFVDAAIMALAERLNIATVYTFDRRDFRLFRPAHRPYLRLLP